ncbi:MAG: hypothetical protein WKF34_07720 [Pyrinomonadaceae bacterium]
MKVLFSIALFLIAFSAVAAQDGGMALSPARFELEMAPGTETTVVVNLDYRSGEAARPARIVASLNDWTITPEGRVEYFAAGTRRDSASPWLIYTPGQAVFTPGKVHQIRVTISVPANAAPGDHLAALVVEQRPETLKPDQQNMRQVVVRYRMASVFYIKVAGLTRHGSFENLTAESTDKGILVTPTLKNDGNSMVRPLASVRVYDADGKLVAEMPALEPMPLLAGSETNQGFLIEKRLGPGNYSIKYRVDFHDGQRPTEGVTDFDVKARPQIAATGRTP